MKISAFLQSINQNSKANAVQTSKEPSVSESLITDYKSTVSKDVQSIFDKYQIKPTPDQQSQVSSFMSGAKGTESQKLHTLDVALYKGIEPTADNLMSVHQALTHDVEVVKSLTDTPVVGDDTLDASAVQKTIDALKVPEAVKTILKKHVASGLPLREALRAVVDEINAKFPGAIFLKKQATVGEMVKALQLVMTDKTGGMKALLETSVLLEADSLVKPNDAVAMTERRSQPRFSAGILREYEPSDKGFVKNSTVHAESGFNLGISNDLDALKDETGQSQSHETSRDSVSESHLTSSQTSETLESSVTEFEATALEDGDILSMVEQVVASMVDNMDAVFAKISESMDLKSYLVETTTEATIGAKKQFDAFRAETVKLLQTAVEPQNTAQMAANISKAIEKLNHILMKSEVTLYTDMFTEKKLLVMASELDKAQGYVKQGDLSKAHEVVKKATSLLEQIRFNPSQRRVQVFAQNKMEKMEKVLEVQEKNTQKLDGQILKQIENTQEGQGSKMAREILETLRFLGLNHEMEVAESLDGVDDETQKDWAQGNVKELLLKLMKEEVKDRAVAATEQNLMNFSGQQMMNDTGSGQQPFYFFNYPIMDGEELGNMKVYMKGASKNQQMDWKNSELYFGVTLKNTGALGIKVKIQQEKVSFEVLSNTETGIEQKLSQVLDELSEIGFSKGDVVKRRYSDDTGIVLKPVLEASQSVAISPSEGKGFDFKI